jgi:primosomal protein N' (replication factor Y) (superfamily II helicase)
MIMSLPLEELRKIFPILVYLDFRLVTWICWKIRLFWVNVYENHSKISDLDVMYYYQLVILRSSQDVLVYASEIRLNCGEVVEVFLKNRQVRAVILNEVRKPSFACKMITPLGEYFDTQMMKYARFINHFYCSSLGESLGLFFPKKHGVMAWKKVHVRTNVVLNEAQQNAATFLQSESISLLFGDTGSGKTEIYIKAIEESINAQKTALFLMPEISLTPQIETRLKQQFGDLVAIWHSKISKQKKETILKGIMKGETHIIAGARSALFLPLCHLGVIVVDEEHDDSYKAHSKPRYHARDLAIYFGKECHAKVILGSATPSVTSYARYPYFRLKGRYFGSKKAVFFDNAFDCLTPFVLQSLDLTLQKQEQAIVFLPTRANFKHQICHSCGKSVQCPYCSVSMSLHRNDLVIRCHYCGYTESIPHVCPHCHHGVLHHDRMGTAEVVEQLQAHFPMHTIAKFDRDTVSTEKKLKKLLNAFNNGEIDILVGTQMLSKGHDYHYVTLAVVLGIDYMLHIPDYRSCEKTLALLHQIAGRSGRRKDGNVIVQTRNSAFFKTGMEDYAQFLECELKTRQALYPPHTKMAIVHFSHRNEQKAYEEMQKGIQLLEGISSIEMVGAGKAAIEKIANRFRYHILLRSISYAPLLQGLHALQTCKIRCEIDMNPIHFH